MLQSVITETFKKSPVNGKWNFGCVCEYIHKLLHICMYMYMQSLFTYQISCSKVSFQHALRSIDVQVAVLTSHWLIVVKRDKNR